MHNQAASNRAAGSWLRPMVARSGIEPHRAVTPLELLFDLCFVAAVALAGTSLHHAVSEDHIGDGIVSYLLVFFAIGWALFVVFSMWWLYFGHPAHRFLVGTDRDAFLWGYGHYLIFSSAAAVGAGLAVAIDYATHGAHAGSGVAGGAVTVPVAVYLLSVWLLHVRPHRRGARYGAGLPVAAGAVLAVTAAPWPFALPLTAAATTALVVAYRVFPW